MKHKLKITIIILIMFLLTQFIGLYVVNSFAPQKIINGNLVNASSHKILPYGMEIPNNGEKNSSNQSFISIIFSFIIAIALVFLLMKFKRKFTLKIWFLAVSALALGITFTSIFPWAYASLIALVIAVPLAIWKIYGKNLLVHNFTELLIYPGIAAIFVPLLNLKTAIIFLVAISIYDMWAVWKSKIMQKMAKFQMDELKIFPGFFLPVISQKDKEKIKKWKKLGKSLKNKKIKVGAAILGGGDIVFPIIICGVVLKTWGIWPSIFIILGALIGLGTLLFFSKKKRFYPAMPFISIGIFVAMIISWIFYG